MKDATLKYLEITKDFPNKAGALNQAIKDTRREIRVLMGKLRDHRLNPTLVAASVLIDRTDDMLKWVSPILSEVVIDFEYLKLAAEGRNSDDEIEKFQTQKQKMHDYIKSDLSKEHNRLIKELQK